MDFYNVYGNKIKTSQVSKNKILKKMKENNLLLIDKLGFDYNKEWINIFGKKREYYSSPNDYISGHIYIIKNIKTNFVYIGQTEDIIKRRIKHLSDLTNFIHISTDMQMDYILYGENSFIFGIIEFDVLSNDLLTREKYWIKYFNSEFPNGYNMPYIERKDYHVRLSKQFVDLLLKAKKERNQFKNKASK